MVLYWEKERLFHKLRTLHAGSHCIPNKPNITSKTSIHRFSSAIFQYISAIPRVQWLNIEQLPYATISIVSIILKNERTGS